MEDSLEAVSNLCSGPRYTENGEIIPYSILGSVNDFKQSHLASTGDEVILSSLECDNKTLQKYTLYTLCGV